VVATDPYVVLGVAPDATPAEIVHAYRRLVRQHHPDLRAPDAAPDDSTDADLERVLQAYATLRGAEPRGGKDRLRRSGGTPEDPVRPEGRPARPPRSQPLLRAGPVFWQPFSR
jgi:curved DNA-binding protein CbpA